jgi:O-antigen/teichoic acid export membrane protein
MALRVRTRRVLGSPGSFTRNTFVLAGSSTLGQALLVIASPILTRLYTPADFGLLAGYVSVLGLSLAVVSLRYEMAIPLPADEQSAADVLGLGLWIATSITLLAGGCLWVGSRFFAARGIFATGYVWLVPFGLFSGGVYQLLAAWAVRRGHYRSIGQTRLVQTVMQTFLQIAGGVAGLGILGLLVGDVAGRGAGSTSLARRIWREERVWIRGISRSGMVAAAKRYRHFPLYASGSTFLNQAGLQLPALLFAVLYGPAVAGYFLLAQRVAGMPMTLVGLSVSQVYLGRAAELKRESPHLLLSFFRSLSKRLLLMGLSILLPCMVLPYFFGQIFGHAWVTAGDYIRLLAPMFVAQLAVSPLSQITAVLERQKLQLSLDVVRSAILAVAILLPWAFSLGHYMAIGSYSAGMLLSYILFYVAYSRLLGQIPGAKST